MNKQDMSEDMENSYRKFKETFDVTYNLPDIHPSLIKLCFCKGYERGLKDMYNTMADELLPDYNTERL